MRCAHCDGRLVAFAVPEDLRAYAERDEMTVCSRCLRTATAETAAAEAPGTTARDVQSPDDADFSAIDESFPDGRAGVAFALAVGKLGSLALNRADIESLFETAEREGADVCLTLDRLSTATDLEPYFDVERRTGQLESFD